MVSSGGLGGVEREGYWGRWNVWDVEVYRWRSLRVVVVVVWNVSRIR